MVSIISVDPLRCRVWRMHDRLEEGITKESCREEIESIKGNGQYIPAKGRPVKGDPDCDVEIVCGARRLFVARFLKINLLVELKEFTDKEAIIAMDAENRHRKDLSPYERGLSYATYLRAGYFKSQDDIARSLKVSASQVSRLLKLTRLPSVVVNAFSSPIDIHENWGGELSDLVTDPQTRSRVIQVARKIANMNPRPTARRVFQRLLASSIEGKTPRDKARDQVIKDDDGVPLFRIRYHGKAVALMLPIETISARSLQAIQSAIKRILKAPTTEASCDEPIELTNSWSHENIVEWKRPERDVASVSL